MKVMNYVIMIIIQNQLNSNITSYKNNVEHVLSKQYIFRADPFAHHLFKATSKIWAGKVCAALVAKNLF